MRLQLHTDYALRTLVFLAASEGGRVRVADIAAAYGISHPHLLKVANHLAHLGYVDATRGRGGGLLLARTPAQIRIGEIVRALEGTEGILPCLGSAPGECAIEPSCMLRGVMAEAQEAFFATLDQYTLAQMTRNRPALIRILRKDPC